MFIIQEAEKEVDTLTRYKRQLHNTNSRLENEMEETKKLLVARDQVCNAGMFIRWKYVVKVIWWESEVGF